MFNKLEARVLSEYNWKVLGCALDLLYSDKTLLLVY